MSDLILTGWAGVEFAEIAAHTLPVLRDYATVHGVSFGCANLAGDRPASWMKVLALREQLERFDRIAWIDADVVVLDHSKNIFDELGDGWHGLVRHHTPSGVVPNCGVWIVTKWMTWALNEVWNARWHINHPWWEQAAVLELMGYAVLPGPFSQLAAPTELYSHTTWLGPEWNHHPADTNRVASPRFLHVTQYPDRLATVREHTRSHSADS